MIKARLYVGASARATPEATDSTYVTTPAQESVQKIPARLH
jgi:hypothetical protein